MISILQHLEHTADFESTTKLPKTIKNSSTSNSTIHWQCCFGRLNLILFWLKQIADAYYKLTLMLNSYIHYIPPHHRPFTAKEKCESTTDCPLEDRLHQVFKCPFFIDKYPEKSNISTRNIGVSFSRLNKGHDIANCPQRRTADIESAIYETTLHFFETTCK